MSFFTGTPGKYKQLSTLEKSQQPLKNQLFGASQGAFQSAADYYRNILGDQDSTMGYLAEPELRRFRESTIPDLAAQFAGMGFGGAGLGSSGFRNAAVSAGTDLGERLAAMRAQLRQQAAQGLMGIGQAGLQPFVQNVYEPPNPGLLQNLAPIAGAALGAFGGSALGSMGGALGDKFSNWLTGNKTNQNDQIVRV